jgi:hypothetical protein
MSDKIRNISSDRRKLERIETARRLILAILENITPDSQEAIDACAKCSAQIVFAVQADANEFKRVFEIYYTLMSDANATPPVANGKA